MRQVFAQKLPSRQLPWLPQAVSTLPQQNFPQQAKPLQQRHLQQKLLPKLPHRANNKQQEYSSIPTSPDGRSDVVCLYLNILP